MSWGGWLLVIGGGAAGYWLFRRLKRIEAEILEEVRPSPKRESPAAASGNGDGRARAGAAPSEKEEAPRTPGVRSPEPEGELETRVLEIVRSRPGILQTALYDHFPEGRRRELQALLLQMNRDGRLSRAREGSTYRLNLPDEESQTAS